MKLLPDVSEGRKVFGVSWSELIDQYVEYRRIDTTIISNNIPRITIGHLNTIKTYLDRFLDVIGHQTKVSELDMSSLFDYLQRRQAIRSWASVTVRNEQSSINHMVKRAFHKKFCLTLKILSLSRSYSAKYKLSTNTYEEVVVMWSLTWLRLTWTRDQLKFYVPSPLLTTE